MQQIFPNPRNAPKSSPLAYGGDFSPKTLLLAYENGIFPWFIQSGVPFWFSPDPRCVLIPSEFKLHKSLKPFIKKYSVKFDANVRNFIKFCKIQREKTEQTWIRDEFVKAYGDLADLNIAHSAEVFYENELIGGLYGLIIGKIFCGESMISMQKNASKVALYALCEALKKFDFLIDCQVPNDHLIFMGAKTLPRSQYLDILAFKKNECSGFSDFKNLSSNFKLF